MKVDLVNVLAECPKHCADLKVEHCVYFPMNSASVNWDLQVLVDCAHSGVCKFRKENEDERTTD